MSIYIDRLYPYLDPETALMPEGSTTILMDWRGVWVGLGALAGVILIVKLLKDRRG